MVNLNKVFLIGNLTRNPEMRHTPNDVAVTDLRLAINRRYKTSDGQEKEETCYVSVVVWGKQAESCNQYLRKGSSVFVEGRLQYDEWDDKEKGQKINRLRVVADRVQFLSTPGKTTTAADVASAGDSVDSMAKKERVDDVEDGKEHSQDSENLPF